MSQSGGETARAEVLRLRHRYMQSVAVLEIIRRLSVPLWDEMTFSQWLERMARILIEKTAFDSCAVFRASEAGNGPELLIHLGATGDGGGDRLAEEDLFGPGSPLLECARRVWIEKRWLFLDAMSSGFLMDMNESWFSGSILGLYVPGGYAVILSSRQDVPCPLEEEWRCWESLVDVMGRMMAERVAYEGLAAEKDRLRRQCDERGVQLQKQRADLETMEQLLTAILDMVPQGICLLDEEGVIVRANGRMATLLDLQEAELVGRPCGTFFAHVRDFQQIMEQTEGGARIRLSDQKFGGDGASEFPADISIRRLPADLAGPVRFVLVAEDISQKKAFSEQLNRTEKLAALGTMAGGVAHDFNNILMSILGNTQLLAQEMPPGCEGAERRLRSIEQAVTDGSHIVRRLQQFTEKESARGRGKQEADLRSAVIDTLDLTRPRWKNTVERAGHTIEVRKDLQEGVLGAIHPADLREVLTNLVFNAVDAMPRGGRLSFRAFRRSDRAILEVSDTGIGMDEGTVQKIFDPFFSTKGAGNSGLGLSVCRSLIHRMGGEMHVYSEPGKGTTFTIDLPAVDKDARDQSARLDLRLKTAGKNLLVVDDEKEILERLRDMLRLMGHRVTATHDPAQALSHLETATFDLVLTDLAMPEVSGWDVAKAAKAARESLPVILVTGWGAQYEGEDLRDKGVDLVLSKPLSYQKLLESLSRFV
ncbi:PAS domain S-box-containing protein [Desulfacinum hydrothermale DSM 13146]|uniref:histidine kinase n=1 Tax=Desulfacinum hydrothermale DSM 13146 TaxID=1121390 RepID=A0A1W1X6W8_9BACT|nr:PAS domain-containing hybrid sensor histidine kinase/response regulator [Desulfacinum hydrothermale]SMC19478.1 PAS domain S-box-containing protein [Desulfacinum hydrothermale DSM 13146]